MAEEKNRPSLWDLMFKEKPKTKNKLEETVKAKDPSSPIDSEEIVPFEEKIKEPIQAAQEKQEDKEAIAAVKQQLEDAQAELAEKDKLLASVPSGELTEADKTLIKQRKGAITGKYKELAGKLKAQKNKTALLGLVNLMAQTGLQIAAAQQGLATGRDLSGVKFNKDNFLDKVDAIEDRLNNLAEKEVIELQDVEDARIDLLKQRQKGREEALSRVEGRQKEERDLANRIMLKQMDRELKAGETKAKEQDSKEAALKEAKIALETIQGFNEEALKDAPAQSAINKITKGYGVTLNELGRLVEQEIKGRDPEDYENWIVALEDLTADDVNKIDEMLKARTTATAPATQRQLVKMRHIKTGKIGTMSAEQAEKALATGNFERVE